MKVVEFSKYPTKLKKIKRAGWVREGIPDPENVADHSFGVALLASILTFDEKIDRLKAVKMALIHDLGESITGDIVTDRGVKVDQKLLAKKQEEEVAAMRQIFKTLGSDEFVKLFEEIERGQSAEARFVRQLDKLEMVMQAHSYETENNVNLEEFYQTGFQRITDKNLRKILDELYSTRPKSFQKK